MRHLQGFEQNPTTTKNVEECYEKSLFDSELSHDDKFELGRSYLDYLRETCVSISQIKQTEDKLRDVNVYDSFALQKHFGRQNDTIKGSLLGKRQRFE